MRVGAVSVFRGGASSSAWLCHTLCEEADERAAKDGRGGALQAILGRHDVRAHIGRHHLRENGLVDAGHAPGAANAPQEQADDVARQRRRLWRDGMQHDGHPKDREQHAHERQPRPAVVGRCLRRLVAEKAAEEDANAVAHAKGDDGGGGGGVGEARVLEPERSKGGDRGPRDGAEDTLQRHQHEGGHGAHTARDAAGLRARQSARYVVAGRLDHELMDEAGEQQREGAEDEEDHAPPRGLPQARRRAREVGGREQS